MALDSTDNPRYGMNASPEIKETKPSTTVKHDAGFSWSLYENTAAKAQNINAIGVTIPCIGLESSGNNPTPIVASPVIRNKTKKTRDELNLRIKRDERKTLSHIITVDAL